MTADPAVLHIDTERGWRGGQRQAAELHRLMLEGGLRSHMVCRAGSKMAEYMRSRRLPFHTEPMRGELDLPSAWRMAGFCRREGFGILWMHSAHALSLGLLARLRLRRLRTVAVRRVDFPIRGNPLSRLKYNTALLDRIVAISANVRRVLVADGIDPARIELIRSGIDTGRFRGLKADPALRAGLGIPEDAVVVGTVAAMVGHKDYPTLLRAAERVIGADGRIHFIAAGDGPLEGRIGSLAEELKLQGRFHFLGRREDIGSVLAAMDVFVLASRMEGLGTATLEAMAAGLPVVGTDAGGIPEVVSSWTNGLLVPAEDPRRLAEAMLLLCRDGDMRRRFGEASRDRAEGFDIALTARRSIELCRSLP